MEFLPIFINLRGARCLVVGGNESAARKAALLLQAGAQVTVAAPALAPAFASLSPQDHLQHHQGEFADALLDGMALVICAHEDEAMCRNVSECHPFGRVGGHPARRNPAGQRARCPLAPQAGSLCSVATEFANKP